MSKIDEFTIGELKEVSRMLGSPCRSTPMVSVGDKVFIRTVTYHLLGKVAEVNGSWVKLIGPPSWVASSGRWSKALNDGTLDEVEICGEYCWVNLDTATDIHPWVHSLPSVTK